MAQNRVMRAPAWVTGGGDDGSIESPRFMWVMCGTLFMVGSAIGAISVALPHPATFNTEALWVNISASFAIGALCIAVAGRLPTWLLHVVLLGGTLAVTRAVYFSGEPNGFYTLFYIWVGLYAFFFFSQRAAIAHMAAIGVAYAWVLAELDASSPLARWTTTIGTLGLAAYLIDALVRRVRRMAASSATLAEERAELLELLEEVARTDELTGLPNRRAWDEQLERELARAVRDGSPLCIGIVDLDRFKDFNDRHGHQAGDRMLKEITAAWREQLRAADTLARYGGEEFTLTLPGCDLDDARRLLERIRAAMPAGETCSGGVVIFDGAESDDELFGRADRALYAAKEAGRDRIVTG